MAAMTPDIYAWTSDWAIRSGLAVWKAEETVSTNTVAKNDTEEATSPRLVTLSDEVSSPTLYLAKHQTQGRGRGTNTWSDREGTLLATWSFALREVPQPILSPLVGLALYKAMTHVWGAIRFSMKAPNDLYIGDKKVAGLLIETIDQGSEKRTVVGLGLNVAAKPDLDTATDLASHLGSAGVSRAKWDLFLDAWVAGLKKAMKAGLIAELDFETRESLKTALNRFPLLKEPILDVDTLGQLQTASGIIRWHEL